MNFEPLLTRLKSLGAAFSPVQLASLVGAFLLVVGVIIGAAWWLNTTTYQVLLADMDAEAAAQVTARLRAQEVPYQLVDGGRTVLVPDEQVDELRLDLASQGMPASGRMGFEIFDRTQFGATEFLEQVNFRRALEGEIARTIGTLAEVAGARVHIAMAKDSLFGQREQPAKASVVLKLRSNRPLAASTAQAIVALTAASVEGLRPESVVLVDSYGRPLARPGTDDDDEPLGSAQVERQQRFEQDMAARVVALLEPVVGAGRARVNVAARLHLDSQDQIEERWDPTPVVRSRAVTMEGAGGAALAQGVAGTRANLPGPVPPGSNEPATPTAAPPPSVTNASIISPVRTSETINNELGKSVTHTVRPAGGVARLSVAVIVDDVHAVEKDESGNPARTSRPRDPAEIQKLHGLVAAAVGLDPTRGDQLTVENIAFDEQVPEELPAPGVLERFAPQVSQGLKVVVVLVLGGLAFLLIGRPLMRRAVIEAQPVDEASLPRQLPRTIEQIEGEIAAQLDASTIALDRRLPVLTKRLTGLAQKDPEVAARLVRTWLSEEAK